MTILASNWVRMCHTVNENCGIALQYSCLMIFLCLHIRITRLTASDDAYRMKRLLTFWESNESYQGAKSTDYQESIEYFRIPESSAFN